MSVGITEINRLKIESNLTSIPKVESLIDQVCKDLSLDEDAYGNVLIAVTEAVNNAIIHGNKFDESLFVEVLVGITPNEVSFTIQDEGKGFDFLNLPDPTSPENIELENGRGLFLIKNLSDELSFDNNGSVIHIVFNKQ